MCYISRVMGQEGGGPPGYVRKHGGLDHEHPEWEVRQENSEHSEGVHLAGSVHHISPWRDPARLLGTGASTYLLVH